MNSCVFPPAALSCEMNDGGKKDSDKDTEKYFFPDKVSQGKKSKRVPWSKSEDELLKELVRKYGEKKWKMIAERIPGRTGKQCRQRWLYNLTPELCKTRWTEQEDILLLSLHNVLGNRWTQIRRNLPGRSENDVKNHFHCLMNRIQKKIPSAMHLLHLSQLHAFSPDNNVSSLADPSTPPHQCNSSLMVSDLSNDVFTVSSSLVSSDSVNDYPFSFDLPESPCEVEESPLTSNVVSVSDAIVS